jgi:hypothetical protein
VQEELAAIPVLDGRRRSHGIAIRHLARAVRLDLSVPERASFLKPARIDPTGLHRDPNEGKAHGRSS